MNLYKETQNEKEFLLYQITLHVYKKNNTFSDYENIECKYNLF